MRLGAIVFMTRREIGVTNSEAIVSMIQRETGGTNLEVTVFTIPQEIGWVRNINHQQTRMPDTQQAVWRKRGCNF